MRSRRCSFSVFLAFLSLLCACGKPQQTVTISPFTADLSFSFDNAAFEGIVTLKNSEDMQLMLRTPSELQGLRFDLSNDNAMIRFGDASVSLDDAEALGLPPAALHALFEALSSLCNAPHTKSDNGTVEISTSRGTASVAFLPDQPLPLRAEIGDLTFSFGNQKVLAS